MRPGSLAEDLARAEALKAEMASLLRELESAAAGRPVQKTGLWRHRRPAQDSGSNRPAT